MNPNTADFGHFIPRFLLFKSGRKKKKEYIKIPAYLRRLAGRKLIKQNMKKPKCQ